MDVQPGNQKQVSNGTAISVIFSNGFIHRRREEIIVFRLDFSIPKRDYEILPGKPRS